MTRYNADNTESLSFSNNFQNYFSVNTIRTKTISSKHSWVLHSGLKEVCQQIYKRKCNILLKLLLVTVPWPSTAQEERELEPLIHDTQLCPSLVPVVLFMQWMFIVSQHLFSYTAFNVRVDVTLTFYFSLLVFIFNQQAYNGNIIFLLFVFLLTQPTLTNSCT